MFSLNNPAFVAFDINLFNFDSNEERAIFSFLFSYSPNNFLINEFSQVSMEDVFKIIFSSLECLFLKLLLLVIVFWKLSRNCLLLQSFYCIHQNSLCNFFGVTEIMLYTATFANPHAIGAKIDILFLSR